MSQSAVVITPSFDQPAFLPYLRLIPGVALLAAIGLLGKVTEQSITRYGKAHHLALPNFEYVLWAILFGLIVANTTGVPSVFRAGVATYEFWLKAGIVLLGVRFLLGDVLKLGGVSLVFVAVELTISIIIMTLLGRWLGLSPKLTSLLAIGSSICGVSAIIAAKGAIDADDEDSSYAIAAILALGAFSLFAFPAIGHALGLSDHAFGLWAGLAVDNTAEATAAGALYSDAAAKFAVLAKTTRNATIGFVVLGYALYWARKSHRQSVQNKAAFLWQKFPKFVLGFLLVSALATAGVFAKPQLADIANLSRWAFLLTFAGVGLQTNFGQLRKQGLRPLVVGAVGECAIASITLALIFTASRTFGLF
ncbi:MAG: YeiH family protein [Bryobacteraceae bacterium]